MGTLVTAVVTAVVAALATNVSQKVSGVDRPPPRQGPPINVQHVAAAPTGGDSSFVFPQPVALSRAQLRAFQPDGGPENNWAGKDWNYPWAWRHGGASINSVTIKLELRGNRAEPIRIQGMELVKRCTKPHTGTLFESPPSGENVPIFMGFDLDEFHSTAQLLDDQGEVAGPYFSRKTITLTDGEKQQLQITARTKRQACDFHLDVQVLDGTTIVHQKIDNNGQPFRVSASAGPLSGYQRLYVGGVISHDIGCAGWVEVSPPSDFDKLRARFMAGKPNSGC
ncbi:hypothetical protein [Streptosporangium sp. KLBMP 9127]|nr:hypothetical protein [Streptosporangium sp. KLBMP 9127]